VPDPHATLHDLCLAYGDFNRPVFLEAFLRWFLDSAGPKELAALRRAIRSRAKTLSRGGKGGRPRAEHDPDWLRRSAQLVWQKDILHWTWPKIAASAGMKPTNTNIRTLQNRRDHFALIVWRAIQARADSTHELSHMLKSKRTQRSLRASLALPFHTHPEDCRKLVLTLFSRGLHVAARTP
jgi:hypothetical protein